MKLAKVFSRTITEWKAPIFVEVYKPVFSFVSQFFFFFFLEGSTCYEIAELFTRLETSFFKTSIAGHPSIAANKRGMSKKFLAISKWKYIVVYWIALRNENVSSNVALPNLHALICCLCVAILKIHLCQNTHTHTHTRARAIMNIYEIQGTTSRSFRLGCRRDTCKYAEEIFGKTNAQTVRESAISRSKNFRPSFSLRLQIHRDRW